MSHSPEPWIEGYWTVEWGCGGKKSKKTRWTFHASSEPHDLLSAYNESVHSGVSVGEVREQRNCPDTKIFGECGDYDNPYDPPTSEDMARVIACVNACKGISTEDLELVASEGVLMAWPNLFVERFAKRHDDVGVRVFRDHIIIALNERFPPRQVPPKATGDEGTFRP